MKMGASSKVRQKGWKKETDGWSKGRVKREMAKTVLKAVTKDRKVEENWIEVEGKRIQIREVWKSGDKSLLIVVNGNPGL